jgi:hypothetical protein
MTIGSAMRVMLMRLLLEEVAQQDPYEFENLCDESNSDAAAALSLSSFARLRADINDDYYAVSADDHRMRPMGHELSLFMDVIEAKSHQSASMSSQ